MKKVLTELVLFEITMKLPRQYWKIRNDLQQILYQPKFGVVGHEKNFAFFDRYVLYAYANYWTLLPYSRKKI